MEEFLSNITKLHFYQAVVISVAINVSDLILGLIAAKASGRHIKSKIMVACQDKKMQSFFKYIIMGTGFHVAALLSIPLGSQGTDYLSVIAAIVVILPALPEIVSVFENIKIIKSKNDTKPKE